MRCFPSRGTFRDAPSKDTDDSPNKAAVDFQFRFVASELEKKCDEYDQIVSTEITDAANGTRKGDEKFLLMFTCITK
ncbi:unnamed protein product [Litomosoides sigmodontis]|uniref:Uncharacterized protein n=1 Tax=Litomosoides sigmodontis TaxID=42156 RepID=A0A3P6TE00_LITSI|nr:unnamed protein product [Litomosoides sigmodontis]